MIRLALTVIAFLSLMAGASAAAPTASFTITVSSLAFEGKNPRLCIDVYTLANGNPFCKPIFNPDDTPVGGATPIPEPSSAAWFAGIGAAKAGGAGTVGLTDESCSVDTAPGSTNYGKDSCQSTYYNPNGAGSIATTGMTHFVNLTCNTSLGSCGHGWSGEALWAPSGARAQNPNSDHHLGAVGVPCDSGRSAATFPGTYTIAAGDRCENAAWLVQPGYPSPAPIAGATTFTDYGEGQADMDAVRGWYNTSGVTASQLPLSFDANPADIVTAVQNLHSGTGNSYLPYALVVAAFCTSGNAIMPSSYFDVSNGACPPNGARLYSKITDAQVKATSWDDVHKVLMMTAHHFGMVIDDTTGGYGNGLSIQLLGGSGFTNGASSDTDSTDPYRWLADNGGQALGQYQVGYGGVTELSLDVPLSNMTPYTVASDFVFCHFAGTWNHVYAPNETLPNTCGSI